MIHSDVNSKVSFNSWASEEDLTLMADEDSNKEVVINISYSKDVLMDLA
jgi:hypothetical protein